MARSMARKKRLIGGLVYTFFLLLWAGLLVYGVQYVLDRVWLYAGEYEASRPHHTMDEYVAELSRNLWDEEIEETVKSMRHEVQTDDEVAGHVREMLSSGISYVRKGGSEGQVYALRCNGHEFGTVTIVERDDYVSPIDTASFPWTLLPWSIRPWRVESESFDFNGLYSSVEVVIPRSYAVYLNGVRLGSQCIVEENIPYDVLEKYYDYGGNLPTKVRYRFDNVIGTIEPEIRNEEGEPVQIDPNRDDSQFLRPCSEKELARLAQFTTGFINHYLKYTSGVIDPQYGYQKLRPYLLGNSDLDQRMQKAMDGLSWAHTASINIQSAQLNGALALGDHYYLLDITSVATTYTNGKGEVESTSNMRVVAREKNDDVRALSLELY